MTTRASRRILFSILLTLFLITTPLVVLYSFGYRYSLDRGIFVYSGSISLKTSPQEIVIQLDGKPVPQKKINFINNFTHINGIRPDSHTLEVSAPGYSSWRKKLDVHSGVSTEFWNVFLTKQSYERVAYPVPGADRFFVSPKNDRVAVVQTDGSMLTISIVTLADQSQVPIFVTAEDQFTSDPLENIEWTPQGTKIIIPLEKDGVKNYFIGDTEAKIVTNLNELIEQPAISHVRWDPDQKNTLFYLANNSLYQYSNTENSQPKLLVENISSYDVSSNALYFFKLPEGIVYKSALDDASHPTQITLESPDRMIDPTYRIVTYDDHRIWMINNARELYVFNEGERETYFRKLADGVVGAQFSNDGKKLLYWTEREIYVYFTRDWETQPNRSENDILNITRFSQKIDNVQWLQDYEHVLFNVGQTIKLVELDNRDFCYTMDVLSVAIPDVHVFNSYSQSELYFTDQDPLNPGKNTLYSIFFYEKTGLFGLGG